MTRSRWFRREAVIPARNVHKHVATVFIPLKLKFVPNCDVTRITKLRFYESLAQTACDFFHIPNADQKIVRLPGCNRFGFGIDATIFLCDPQTGSGRELSW